MKELYTGLSVVLTNEEEKFLTFHGYDVHMISLNERDEWIAQSLIRKGIYELSSDRKLLIKQTYAKK